VIRRWRPRRPVCGSGPRLHPTAEEAEALSVIGELLGSLYRGELAGRIGCGVMDREGHAVWQGSVGAKRPASGFA
jgi:hypothetical protein